MAETPADEQAANINRHTIARSVLSFFITDTSEYHYQSWQQLADDQGWHFDRQVNEWLRGIPRRASLDVILAENQVTLDEAQIPPLLERKNDTYKALLEDLTPADLLPGALELIQELRAARVQVAMGSAISQRKSPPATDPTSDRSNARFEGPKGRIGPGHGHRGEPWPGLFSFSNHH